MPQPIFFEVPAGTPASECRSCRATIYWIETKRGKRMPVDVDVEGGYPPGKESRVDPRLSDNGMGVSHFVTCPHAKQWSTHTAAKEAR